MRIHGKVRAADGAPIAGASVVVRSNALRTPRRIETTSDGSYELALSPGSYQIEVIHDGYCSASQDLELGPAGDTADFNLVEGGTIRGRVVARDSGAVVAGATVSAVAGKDFVSATCDDTGVFKLRGLHAGLAAVSASAPGYASMEALPITLRTDEQVDDVELLVDRAYSISGRVALVGELASGIGGVEVRASGRLPASSVSESDGRFEIGGLMPGVYTLEVNKRPLVPDARVRVQIVHGDIAGLELRVRNPVTVAGRVVPPAIADIELAPCGTDRDSGSVRTKSGEDGTFAMHDIPPGEFDLIATTPDGQIGTAHLTIGREHRPDIILELSRSACLGGRVVDEDGQPVDDAHVRATKLDVPPASRFRRGMAHLETTDANGAFMLTGLERGRYVLVVSPKGHKGQSTELDLEDGDRIDQTIAITSPRARLHGRVIGDGDEPIFDAHIFATNSISRGNARMIGSARTDRDGNFVIERVPAGEYELLVIARECKPVRMHRESVETDTPLTIKLAALGSLTMNVTQGGRPAYVELRCGEQRARNVIGSHTFTKLDAGTYRYYAGNRDGLAVGEVVIHGDHRTVDVELAEPGTITGVAVDILTGKPVAGLELMSHVGNGQIDENGRFVVEGVLGEGELSFSPQHHLAGPSGKCRYSVRSGERLDLGRVEVIAPRVGDQGTFGLVLEIKDKALRVAHVMKRSVGQAAGITAGSEIIEVAGRDVRELGAERARQLLASEFVRIGQTITIALSSGDTLTLTSTRW